MAHGRMAGIRAERGVKLTTQPYPELATNEIGDVVKAYRTVTRMRQDDINDFTDLPNRFMSGRKVGKIPTGSTDTAVTDRIGDFNYDASYLYILVDNSGTAEWRRITAGSW